MVLVYIKKFHFKHDGVLYRAGEFINLPENTAAALVKSAPDEFAIAAETEAANEEAAFDDMTMQELRAVAADKGIDTSKAKSKTDLKKLILQADDAALPDVDPAAGIKNG